MQVNRQGGYRGPVRAVVFDWSGTTVDYGSRAPTLSFIELFSRHGVRLTAEEARGPMGADKREHIRQLLALPAVAARWSQAHGRPPGDDDLCRLYADYLPLQLQLLAAHAALIPGTLEVAAALRGRGIRVGSTTAYTAEMTAVLRPAAAAQGYAPEVVVCASDVPAVRPAPWMLLRCAQELGVFPMAAVVQVGDTVPDVLEGINGGAWAVGLSRSGAGLGLSLAEDRALPEAERERRLAVARERLLAAGAHRVVPSVAELLPCIDEIEGRLAAGERP